MEESSEVIRAVGIGGAMELQGGLLRIERSGLTGFVLHGLKGDKEIAVRSITSIQYRRPNFFSNGYLQLGFSGGDEAKRGIVQATQDENTVLFKRSQQADFDRLAEAIRARLRAAA